MSSASATRRYGYQFGFRLIVKCFLQNLREPRLPLRHTRSIVFADDVLGVPEQLRDVTYGYAGLLQENTREGVAETVWRWRLLEGASGIKCMRQTPAPDIRDGFKALRPTDRAPSQPTMAALYGDSLRNDTLPDATGQNYVRTYRASH